LGFLLGTRWYLVRSLARSHLAPLIMRVFLSFPFSRIGFSAGPPPVWDPDRTRMKEFLGQHHAVALEYQSVFHDEPHIAQGVDVTERIARDSYDVSEIALFDRTALLDNIGGPVPIHRKRPQDVGRRDGRCLPRVEECNAQVAAAQPFTGFLVSHAVIPVIEVGRECQRHFLFPGVVKIRDGPPECFLRYTVLCEWSVGAVQEYPLLRHLAVMLGSQSV